MSFDSRRWLKFVLTIVLGFSSGLPLLTTGNTLQTWMTDRHVDLSLIGLTSLIGLPYTLKFLWAPIVDRYDLFGAGRRRSWAIFAQAGIALSLVALGLTDPVLHPWLTAGSAVMVAWFSATQDIALDAHRRESFADHEQGLASSLFVNGYRIGMLLGGAGAIALSASRPWNQVYMILAACMAIGGCATLLSPEPSSGFSAPRSLQEAVIGPLREFFSRSAPWLVLLFIVLYKIGEMMASAMITPLVLDLGYSKLELASIAKSFGLFSTIAGALLGGVLLLRITLRNALVIFGMLQMLSILGFAILTFLPVHWASLAVVVAIENATGGLATAAFAAYMALQCNRAFTATQYALLSSFMGIPRVFLSAPSGAIAKMLGWEGYFIFCTVVALPGVFLAWRLGGRIETTTTTTAA